MFAKANIKPYEWMYFGLLLVLAFAQLISKLVSETGGIASRYGGFLVIGLVFIAFLGNRYNKAFLYRWVWLVSFWLLAISVTASLVFSTYLLAVNGEEAGIYAGALFVMPFLFVPGLWQLYQYVWNRKALWQNGIDQSKQEQAQRS